MTKTQNQKKFKTLDFRMLLAFVFSFLLFSPAYAAEIYFGVQNPSVGVGSTFEVGVFLNTEGESINAVEGEILFQTERVSLKEVREGDSLVSLWVKKPAAPASAEGSGEAKQEIFFSGLVPGGFTGEDGYLFSLFFEAVGIGETRIQTNAEQILLADGKGSKAIVKQAPLVFDITREAQAVNELTSVEDSIPPESFSPQVARDPRLLEGKWFLVFAAQDKGFGVSYYEVKEGTGAWKRATSPYILEDQSLRSSVSIKAVDKAGNERIEMLEPQNPGKWYENYFVWAIISGIGMVFLIWGVLKIRSTKHESRNNDKIQKV